MTGWRDVLKIHPACELFPAMSPEELRVLGEDIKANGLTSPIVLWNEHRPSADGSISYDDTETSMLDGRNRLDAMEMVGMTITFDLLDGLRCDALDHVPQRNIYESDEIDPYDYAISANAHRRHLSTQQKSDLIAAVLRAKPERSDRSIAEQLKVSPTTVGKARAQLSSSGQLAEPGQGAAVFRRPGEKPGPIAAMDTGFRRYDEVSSCYLRLCGADYFTAEKLVGCRIEFSTRATIAPFFSVSARLVCHSGSAWNAFHFFSRSASDSHWSK